MSIATTPEIRAATTGATIRADEAAHFGRLAADWWKPKGSSAMLHKVNPLRLGFLRDAIDAHWGGDRDDPQPLAGMAALDVGCGAGLLCEPLARLGGQVTGIDAAEQNIAVARAHAEGAGVLIDYRSGELSALAPARFDLVTAMEVIEHVADREAFAAALAEALAPGGLLVISTPNRTQMSRLLLVEGAELIGAIPRGTHRWEDFLTPGELAALLARHGLAMGPPTGIVYSPFSGLSLGSDLSLNYIATAVRA